ncbi:MAG: SIMPL domain-containing protein [Candidatus Omnitrophota bacterium]|nr:SIMPL domain-containing protein [Candidatus Omnitrophota bacterium]
MRKEKYIILFVSCALGISLSPRVAAAQQQAVEITCPKEEKIPEMVIEKKGVIEVEPDEANITLNVWIEEAKVERAVEKTKEKVDVILKAFSDEGIDQKNIQTTQYQVTPLYEGKKIFSRIDRPTSYSVTHNLKAKVNDLSRLGVILAKISTLESVNLQEVQFTSTRLEDLKREALVKASRQARQTAEEVVTAAGGKLGRILKIEEATNMPISYRQEHRFMKMDAMEMDVSQESVPVEAGTMSIEATSRITFEITN